MNGIPTIVRAHLLRWAILPCLCAVGCCSEEPPSQPSASSNTSASPPNADVPQRRLLGTWRYDKPTQEQLTAIERRSRSITHRDRLTRAAHALARVTKTYTADHRITLLSAGRRVEQRYEVVKLDGASVTLRFFAGAGTDKPFEETLTFVDDDTLQEVIDGVPRTLRRQ